MQKTRENTRMNGWAKERPNTIVERVWITSGKKDRDGWMEGWMKRAGGGTGKKKERKVKMR